METPFLIDKEMSKDEDAWGVDVLLKLQRALPRKSGDALEHAVKLSTLMLHIASFLPSRSKVELGDGHRETISTTIREMSLVTQNAMYYPLKWLTPALMDLLRTLAKGSFARSQECAFQPQGQYLPGKYRTHRYGAYKEISHFVDSLAQAELAYDVYCEGLRRLKNLDTDPFYEMVNNYLCTVPKSMVLHALPLAFDGLRLRRGLEVAAPCGLMQIGQRAPFGLDSTAATLLSDGETAVDRERVGRAAQFIMAACGAGVKEYDDPYYVPIQCFGQGGAPPEDPGYHLAQLEKRLLQELEKCREEYEQRCCVPGKSMRIIMEHMVQWAEGGFLDGGHMVFRVAFAYPCLVPKNLRKLEGYDGGVLSVWDACNHLLKLHAKEHGELLPIASLLCAVLAGVIGGLMSDTITGPFCVHTESPVMAEVERLNNKWPSGKKVAYDPSSAPAKLHRRGDLVPRGKNVSATAAVCDAIETRSFKPQHSATRWSTARADAALTMHAISHGLSEGPGVFDGRPTDGIVPLKRLYFMALTCDPAFWPLAWDKFKTPFVDQKYDYPMGIVPDDSTEMVWREIMGGSLMTHGPLFDFSRQSFEDTLVYDWKPLSAVKGALEAREAGGNGHVKPTPVMLPSRAMELLAQRGHKRVASLVTTIDNNVKTADGPPIVTRVLESLNAWANTVYPTLNANPLWESCIAHFCAPLGPSKRQRLSPM